MNACLSLIKNFDDLNTHSSGSVTSILPYHRIFYMGSSFSSRRTPPAQQAAETTGGTLDGPRQLSTITEMPLIRKTDLVKLCTRCENIDFNPIFNPASSDQIGRGYVLCLGQLKKNASCGLCRFFYLMRRGPKITGSHGVTEVYTLRSYRLGSGFASSVAYPGSRYAPSMVLCVWAGEPDVSDIDLFGSFCENGFPKESDWIVPQHFMAAPFFGYTEPILRALPFSPTTINYSLLRSWCEDCEIHHSTCALAKKTKPGSDKQEVGPVVRCIDCHTREIVEIETSDRFFALSYVWGGQPAPGSECAIGTRETASTNSVRQLPSGIPNVIEDAMIVVAGLGERYLWVDQYCIDQNHAEDKHAQIGNMASIYEGAYATIVAFSATDSASGLPGVKNLPRKPYPSISVPHSKLSLSAIRPSAITSSKLVNSSVWMTRGWTYQEAILSRRLLIVTDYQVEFVCSNAVWHECTLPEVEDGSSRPLKSGFLVKSVNLLKAITPLERPRPDGKIPVDIEVLAKYIEEYSGRHLSYQSDALNAITGLLSRISTFTYLGIPVYDASELSPARSHTLAVNSALVRFLICLIWYPAKGSLQRRCAFPSWSWLGWEGRVKFPSFALPFMDPRGRYQNEKFRPVASVWITNQVTHTKGETLVPFAHLLQEPPLGKEPTSILPHLTNYLWVEGQVIQMTFTIRHGTGKEEFFLPKSDHPPMGVHHYFASIDFRNRNLNSKSQDAMSERVITEDWDCLLIVIREDCAYRTAYLLILDQDLRDNDTEGEVHHCVVGSAMLGFDIERHGKPCSWDDPSLRRRIKLG